MKYLIILLILCGCSSKSITTNFIPYQYDDCVNYGGKCENPEDSIVVIDGINVREECQKGKDENRRYYNSN